VRAFSPKVAESRSGNAKGRQADCQSAAG